MSPIIRRRIRFYGDVQGVGFRWRARHGAGMAGATGWVRNEADGSVTMELQGREAQIDAVLRCIEQGRYVRVDSMDVRDLPADPEERGFVVRDDRW